MANIQSAIKRNRQNEKHRVRNRTTRTAMRTSVKNAQGLIEAGERDQAEQAVRTAFSKIDRAAKKGIIHKNQAARRKSRLAARLKAM